MRKMYFSLTSSCSTFKHKLKTALGRHGFC
jgi:hypothetical protein